MESQGQTLESTSCSAKPNQGSDPYAMDAFGALSALFREADRPAATGSEIAWFCERIPPDGLALDVMCGWGRVLVPLAGQGRKVHGVDASAAMLARCDARLAATGTATPTFRQDVAQLNLPFRYGHAFIADGAFQLLTDPERGRRRARAHPRAPGRARTAVRRLPHSAGGRAAARRAARRSAHGQARRRHADRAALGDHVDRRGADRARGEPVCAPAGRAAARRGAREDHVDVVCAGRVRGAAARGRLQRGDAGTRRRSGGRR